MAVFGLGAVGLAVIQDAKMAGASRIIAVDIKRTQNQNVRRHNTPNSTANPIAGVLTAAVVAMTILILVIDSPPHRPWRLTAVVLRAVTSDAVVVTTIFAWFSSTTRSTAGDC